MRISIIFTLLVCFCMADGYKSQVVKPSVDKIKILTEVDRTFYANDNVQIKVWAYNQNSVAMPFRYKMFLKVNNTIFRTKKSRISTVIKLAPLKKTLLGTYRQKKIKSGNYRVVGYVKAKNRTLKSRPQGFRVLNRVRNVDIAQNRNSRLRQRIDQRRQREASRRGPRPITEEDHCPVVIFDNH